MVTARIARYLAYEETKERVDQANMHIDREVKRVRICLIYHNQMKHSDWCIW